MRRRYLLVLPGVAVCFAALFALDRFDAVRAQESPTTFVRFAFDGAVLTVEEKAHIASISKYWKRENIRSIKLIGHADGTLGEDEALRLSQDRAKAVKAELVKNGIREQYVSAYWRGQKDPRVQAQEADKNIVEVIFIW